VTISLKSAQTINIQAICDLVNLAYRGEKGWTRETDLVAGDRCDLVEIQQLLNNPNSHLLVAFEQDKLIACINLEHQQECVYIGLFSVEPNLQAMGVGREVLSLAEDYALHKLNAHRCLMVVVSQRPELIAYYERRGYQRTGQLEPYPDHLNVGSPLEKNLMIETLQKWLT